MKTNLQKYIELLGWQGGTIHQVAEELQMDVEDILETENPSLPHSYIAEQLTDLARDAFGYFFLGWTGDDIAFHGNNLYRLRYTDSRERAGNCSIAVSEMLLDLEFNLPYYDVEELKEFDSELNEKIDAMLSE